MKQSKLLSPKIGYPLMGLIGFLFVFFFKTEKNLADWGNILWTAKYTWTTLAVSLVLGGLIGCVFAFLFYYFAGREASDRSIWQKGSLRIQALSSKQVFWISLILIVLSWLPSYLAYYPGICAYDSPIQTGQVVDNSYVDHHPIAHTLLIKAAMSLGANVFGDTNTGIAVYTAFQMLFLACAMSYGLKLLHHFGIKVRWQVLVLLGCMFYPFNWYMSVSMTKDTVFSSFLLFQLVAWVSILLEDRQDLKIRGREMLLFISTAGMILFRNNGKYAMMVPLVFLVLMVWRGKESRKLWSRLLLCCGAAFLVGNIGLSALFSVTKAEQGDRREMLSLPIQQLSRCMIYHGGVGVLPEDDNTMEDADKALINDFILNEAYKDYDPHIADPVKRNTNTYVVRYRYKDFIKTYMNLLTQYPGDMINAGLEVNAGFLYPGDTSHADINEEEGARNKGYVQTRWEEETLNSRGIYKDSKWEWLFVKLEQWSEDNAYLDIPVLKYLFVPGVFLWYYFLLIGVLAIKRRFRMCLPISLIGGYYLTMFLGPTVQLRYIYPVMIALPFLVLLCQGKYKSENGRKKDDI